jgi:hypothetical protein
MSELPLGQGWHALVEVQPVRPIDGWSEGAAGAFVHVLAIAHDPIHYREIVAAQLFDEGFGVIGWKEIKPFDLAINDWHAEEETALHDRLSANHPVQYSHFDTYPKEGLDG